MNPDTLLTHFDRLCEAPGAIPRLRRFILDLAVRGKLVEQDPDDEPGSELLKRIQAERARLVKAGETNRPETLEPISVNEIPFTIPLGWETARLGNLARKLGAGSTPLGGKSVYQSEGVPFLRSQNVFNDGLRLEQVALISRATHERMSGTHIRPEDILLNITGASIGRCALVPSTLDEANVSQHVAIIRLILPVIRTFIHLSLTSPLFQQVIDDVQVGVSREGLSMQRLRLFPMLLPPLAEQHRIVAKVNELMALCDRLEAAQAERERRRDRLAAASLQRLNQPVDGGAFRKDVRFYLGHLPRLCARPDQIQLLRHTILNLAVWGKLVPQDTADEPVSIGLASADESRRTVAKTDRRADADIRALLAAEARWDIPCSWEWRGLADLTLFIDYRGHTPVKVERGVRLITAKNVRKGFVSLTPEGFMSEETYKVWMTRGFPRTDDVLFTTEAPMGNAAVVRLSGIFALAQRVICLRLYGAIDPNFLALQINAGPFQSILDITATGLVRSQS